MHPMTSFMLGLGVGLIAAVGYLTLAGWCAAADMHDAREAARHDEHH
jgi:hypothetical protein